jgi:hypothetical protein
MQPETVEQLLRQEMDALLPDIEETIQEEMSMANPINYAIVIKENTEAEEVVCAVSMVETVPCNEQTQLEAFEYVCGQIGVEYGDFDYRFELYSTKK